MSRSKLPSRLSFCVLITALLVTPWKAAADPSPDGGSYFFARDSGYTTIYQHFYLVPLGYDTHRLNTGGYFVQYGGYQRVYDQSWPVSEDRGLIQVTIHDATSAQIGQSNLGWWDETYWALRGGQVRVTAGTTKLKYLFHADRRWAWVDNDAYLDGAYLRVYEYAIWTWGDNSHNYEGPGPWTVSDLRIGQGGTGGVAVTNSATLTTNVSMHVGDQATGNGTLVFPTNPAVGSDIPFNADGGDAITSARTSEVADTLILAAAGALTLNGGNVECTAFDNSSGGTFDPGTPAISGGGSVTNTFGDIGYDTGSVGTVTVSSTDSTWTTTVHLYVGYFGSGTLNIANGGEVAVAGTALRDLDCDIAISDCKMREMSQAKV